MTKLVFIVLTALPAFAQKKDTPSLTNICLITSDVKRLVDFYEPILAVKAKWTGSDYAELPTGGAVVAIFSAKAQENYVPLQPIQP